MSQPAPEPGQWIRIEADPAIPAYILAINADGSVMVGYLQSGNKPVKESAIWSVGGWHFKSQMPDAVYLHGQAARLVRQGPPR